MPSKRQWRRAPRIACRFSFSYQGAAVLRGRSTEYENICGTPEYEEGGETEKTIIDVAEGVYYTVVGPCSWPEDRPWHVDFNCWTDNEWGSGWGGHANGCHRATKEEAILRAQFCAARMRRQYKRLMNDGRLLMHERLTESACERLERGTTMRRIER